MQNKRSVIALGIIIFTVVLGAIHFASIQTTLAEVLNGATVGTASGENLFIPSSVTIQAGEVVTFANTGLGFHNVVFVSDEPTDYEYFGAVSGEWEVVYTFDEPGTYVFYCEPHQFDDMVGRVVVEGNTSTTPMPSVTQVPTETPTQTPAPTVDPSTLDEFIYLPYIAVP
ncbi:MAG: plastocyanin/azurin family copper-binding protein [Chloroflexota bacterium]